MAEQTSKGHREPSRSEELALLIDAVQDYAIFLLGPDGEIRTWNTGARRIMGYADSEAIGRNFSIFYGPDDLAARKPQRELETAAAVGRVEDEGWRIRKDGKRFWATTVITVLRNPDGTIHGFAKITRDMSERREADERLRQTTEIFQLLVSSVRDYAIFMLDPNGNIATWNPGAQRIKGYLPEEIIGRHFSTFYPEEDLRTHKPERELAIAREKGSVEDEGWRVRKDGSRFWANVVITAVYGPAGDLRGFAKVTRDITDRKEAEETKAALLEQREARLQAEEERRRAEASTRVAQEANRAKDEFLMTLSHELRTPMTAILGWARLLPSMDPTDPLFREAVSSIARGAQLQSRLIDDILDVSRIVSGKLRLNAELVEVSRVITNAVDAVSASATNKQISMTTSLAPALGSFVVDSTRIQQVIWNLLTNAVKFTPRGGSIEVSAKRTGSQVRIMVKDTGEGIDPQFLSHVFEPFRQAEMANVRTHGGLGLGLSIVRYLVEAHGGTVSAESTGRGMGSTFVVSLPVRALSADAEPPRAAAPGSGSRLHGMQIVVVEDDEDSRKMVSAVLKAAGASIRAYDSADAALKGIEEQLPDLVITDIAMPGADGFTVVRALRKVDSTRQMKVVALSAFAEGLKDTTEFDAYLSKPIDPDDLVNQIAKVAQRVA